MLKFQFIDFHLILCFNNTPKTWEALHENSMTFSSLHTQTTDSTCIYFAQLARYGAARADLFICFVLFIIILTWTLNNARARKKNGNFGN